MRTPNFTSDDLKALNDLAHRAVKILLTENLHSSTIVDVPVLLVGATYAGTWLEHNQDAMFLAEYAPENAWATTELFLRRQREDGLLPFCLPRDPVGGFFKAPAVYWQVQTVFSFVRGAVAIAEKAHRPEEDFRRIYDVGCRYDQWFRRHRDRSGTGLVEMYCEYDTGHDNSPRVIDGGIPHSCPENDANNMPNLPCMPLIAADLSATRYGDRIALAALAERLGKPEEAARWRQDAAALKAKMQELLYDEETDFYYDRSPQGLRKYRTEHITRIFLNHVLDQKDFDRIYARYFENPQEFDTPFPYPAISISDPAFVASCPQNCWGANAQANTALRAVIWLKEYNRPDELEKLLGEWGRVLIDSDGDFGQEVNPLTRKILPSAGKYSPSLLLCIEAARHFTGFDPIQAANLLKNA